MLVVLLLHLIKIIHGVLYSVSLIQCVSLITDYSTGTVTQHSQEGPSQSLDPRFSKGVVCNISFSLYFVYWSCLETRCVPSTIAIKLLSLKAHILLAVSNQWTGLLDWTTGMDYWNDLCTLFFFARAQYDGKKLPRVLIFCLRL